MIDKDKEIDRLQAIIDELEDHISGLWKTQECLLESIESHKQVTTELADTLKETRKVANMWKESYTDTRTLLDQTCESLKEVSSLNKSYGNQQ